MKKSWVLVIDSGMGGLWTLNKIKEVLPNESYIYFMDKVNSPYGNKPRKKLESIADEILAKITRVFNIKLVVLACNTLSSIVYDFLTKRYINLPIVKISPFVDAKVLGKNQTLVLATKNTININADLKRYQNKDNIHLFGFGTLAKKIDKNMQNLDVLLPFLSKKLKKFKNFGIKNILLGCTHFNYIVPQLQKIFGDDVCFFENSGQVAKSVFMELKAKNKLSKQKGGETLVLFKI